MTNVNKTIHEAMGRESSYPQRQHDMTIVVVTLPIPDYTDPVHYCALMDWMYEENRSLRFDGFLEAKKGTSYIYFWMRHTREEQVTLIAEAIEAGVLK